MRTKLPLTGVLIWLLAGAPAAAQSGADHAYLAAALLDLYAAADPADRPPPGRVFEADNYWAVVAHREPGPGFSESHAEWTDVYFVTSGAAMLIVGGTIVGAEESAPGEVRGSSIDGGQSRMLAEGDVVHIPPGTAHHVIVPDGSQLTYLLIKIRAGAAAR